MKDETEDLREDRRDPARDPTMDGVLIGFSSPGGSSILGGVFGDPPNRPENIVRVY